MSIRRSILAAVGGFRESFGCDKDTSSSRGTLKWFNHYAGDEETQFCIRVSEQISGSVWYYATSAVVHHRVSKERTHWAYFLWRCYDEGLGKADLIKLHNTRTGLSSERSYIFKALPRGVVNGISDTFLHFDPAGMLRAGTIVVGLVLTIAGFLNGNLYSRIVDFRNAEGTYISYHSTTNVPPHVKGQ